jgi:hypothetical protein
VLFPESRVSVYRVMIPQTLCAVDKAQDVARAYKVTAMPTFAYVKNRRPSGKLLQSTGWRASQTQAQWRAVSRIPCQCRYTADARVLLLQIDFHATCELIPTAPPSSRALTTRVLAGELLKHRRNGVLFPESRVSVYCSKARRKLTHTGPAPWEEQLS